MIYQGKGVVDVPNVDILTLLFETHHGRAKEDAIVHAEAKDPTNGITKAHARQLTKQFAYFLRHEYGIGANGPGKDVVVTVSSGQSALACLFFGVVAADGVYSAASAMNTASDLTRQIKDGPGKVVVCSEDVKETALSAAKAAGLPTRSVLVLESHPQIKLTSVDGSVACDFKHTLDWRVITNTHELEYSKVCVLYSSGTTGLPKGVLVSHQNLVSEAYLALLETRAYYDRVGNYQRRTLGHLPAAHIAGVQGYFINLLYDGGVVYWMPKFNFDDFVKYAASLEITMFFSVPPIFTAIAKHPGVKDQFKHMKTAIVGAAPIGAEMQAEASKKLPGITITQVWGLSETTGAATSTPPERTDTVGSLSPLLPGISLRLVDEDGKDVPAGEPGEALIKGPIVTKGYHNNPQANINSFTEDGWFRTGDVLRMEGDLLYIVDRKKELIKYKGLQVAPAELEGLLEAHPDVADAAVIGIERDGNELPRAYVVLLPSAKGRVSAKDLEDYVQNKVADYKRLRGGVVLVETVPRSPSGKILRKELREMHKKESRQAKI